MVRKREEASRNEDLLFSEISCKRKCSYGKYDVAVISPMPIFL
jgi:hypothetical protein